MFDFDAVFTDIEPQVRVNAHVLVGDPDESEERYQVAAPIVEQQLVMREKEEKRSYVMAEAELAGKEEEKLAANAVGMASLWRTQYSRGSRKTSSCVTVQAMQAMGRASAKSHTSCRVRGTIKRVVLRLPSCLAALL